MQFVKTNFKVLLFIALIIAIIVLLVDKKTGIAIGLLLGYIICYISNLGQLIQNYEKTHKVFTTTSYEAPDTGTNQKTGL